MTADARRPAGARGGRDAAGRAATLGLDLGTSSAKAVVVDTGGHVLSQASAGYPVTSARAGYAESDPAHWWAAVTACAREAVHAAGVRPAAIGLSGQMHGLVLASGEGEALRPALLWADSRATGSLRAYRLLGARCAGPAGQPAGPRHDRAAAEVGRRPRAAHLLRSPLGAAAQGLDPGPPHRRVPRRAQ